MSDPNARSTCMTFIRSKLSAVISTVTSDGRPESSTIYFVIDDNFNVYFMTKEFTRKYNDLENNPHVALVIGYDNEPVTVQMEGKVKRITDKKDYELWFKKLQERLFTNTYVGPLFQLERDAKNIAIYKVLPTWLRWLDLRDKNVNGDFVQII